MSSGVWDAEEYEKRRRYDLEMALQPPGVVPVPSDRR
ncbi:hypothetical protein ACLMAL_36820 [Nocardia sp. CWNU-33]